MNTNLVTYYKDRASEYEKIYYKPERQNDLNRVSVVLQEIFRDKSVLEIACGTGYWTERIARTASSVFATDINEAVVEIARQKDYAGTQVEFGVADLYDLEPGDTYNAMFGGFIWSHIPLQELDSFLEKANSLVSPGGTVVFMDNHFVAGSNTPITTTDEYGNTFQTRKLEDGSSHLVLKNFPMETFLREKLSGIANDIKILNLTCYWILSYKV